MAEECNHGSRSPRQWRWAVYPSHTSWLTGKARFLKPLPGAWAAALGVALPLAFALEAAAATCWVTGTEALPAARLPLRQVAQITEVFLRCTEVVAYSSNSKITHLT